jgi:hypothetical protein
LVTVESRCGVTASRTRAGKQSKTPRGTDEVSLHVEYPLMNSRKAPPF